MASLSSELRRKLEKAVVEARKVAEYGARQALESLTVHEAKRGDHIKTDEQIQLRNRLRAHGRFLGDRRDASGAQSIDRLVEECAYQHWHRILFARFLAENDCLWHPELKALVSLEEVEELAHEEGTQQWELAGRFAQAALPAIFPADNPVLEVKFPREVLGALIELVEEPASENGKTGLVREIFRADDSLGWVYQFWQNDANKRANDSEEKINAATLPAVTQFFTEDYMVMFLLHNTLGAWHAGKVLAANPELSKSAKDEDELRRTVSLTEAGGYEFEYLRFVQVEVEEASSLLPSENSPGNKSLEGSSTFDFTWFDWKEPIHVDSGNLPHVTQEGVTYFVTFRTADSLPAPKWKKWHAQREAWIADHPGPRNESEKKEYHETFSAKIEHWLDQKYGELVLARPEAKKIVDDALHHFNGVRYRLDEYVIAGNHVHALVTPLGEHCLSDVLHSWKSFTANKINKLVGKDGQFWQKESFDHAVRSGESVVKFREYIHAHEFVDAASCRVPPGDKSLEGSSTWRPMGGVFDGWPRTAAELKVLDPCCGSGHFLVAAFELLVRLRMREESLGLSAAIDSVLEDNLFGLELDKRCVQIAVFNVAMSAWKMDRFRELPSMTIAHVGQSIGATREQWMKLLKNEPTAEADGDEGSTLPAEAQEGLGFFWGQLYDMFSKASTLGSLINPRRSLDSLLLSDEQAEYLYELLELAIAADANTDPESHELGLAAKGLATSTKLLGDAYHLVLTNVPFLGRNKQSSHLQLHVDSFYRLGRADLATAFVLRCLELSRESGTSAIVSPQNWFFLTTYTRLREKLFTDFDWNIAVRLGSNAFRDMNWWAATTGLISITSECVPSESQITGLDVSSDKQQDAKASMLRGDLEAEFSLSTHAKQLGNPDARVVFATSGVKTRLSEFASAFQGYATSDDLRFKRCFWELQSINRPWEFSQTSPDVPGTAEGLSQCIFWGTDGDAIELPGRAIRGTEAWSRIGIGIANMSNLPATVYRGFPYDQNLQVIIPNEQSDLLAIWSFCSSPEFLPAIREIDQKVNVTTSTVVKVEFDRDRWLSEASQKFPNGLPEPESDSPVQWLFHGNPTQISPLTGRGKDALTPGGNVVRIRLQVAVARLIGYRWPAELDSEMRLSERARALVARCSELDSFIDDDGIVCIPSVRGEDAAADRLARLLSACDVTTNENLDDWLRNKFFKEHCETFDQRPFVWHIYDGRKQDGFHALVNYHKLASPGGRKVLESLTYSYLGDWITRQKDEVKRELPAAEARLMAAEELFKRLEAILAGEPPYDLFVRWKPIHEQPTGFEPDINDGVRINIRPFMAVDLPGAPKDAGVFRIKPKIKWNKDRGKEPERAIEEYPWFWGNVDEASSLVDYDGKSQDGSSTFTGVRWNDCHYTNEFKLSRRR